MELTRVIVCVAKVSICTLAFCISQANGQVSTRTRIHSTEKDILEQLNLFPPTVHSITLTPISTHSAMITLEFADGRGLPDALPLRLIHSGDGLKRTGPNTFSASIDF